MDRVQARRASQTLEDVFTPDGSAVVIRRLYTPADPRSDLYGKGQCAQVTGGEYYCIWFPISELTAKEDIK